MAYTMAAGWARLTDTGKAQTQQQDSIYSKALFKGSFAPSNLKGRKAKPLYFNQ